MKTENGKMKNCLFTLLACLFLALGLSSCADVDGLHNQESATLTFVFTNFPIADGSYAVPGDYYGSWDGTNTVELITIKGGEGTSSPVVTAKTTVEFTLVKANDSAWLRPWSKRDGGTIEGAGYEGNDYAVNFLAEGIPLGNEVTITVDGSTSPATVTVE